MASNFSGAGIRLMSAGNGNWRRPALIAAVFLAPLLFAAITQQVWEDYYITFRSSRNLVEGNGLVFQPGERVHTFTSPLGVLLPALAYGVTGSETATLWVFRLISAGALAAAAAFILKALEESGAEPRWGAIAVVLCLLEAKVVSFSANGMETGILVFFAALAWRELCRKPAPVVWRLAVAYGGLMWTRPDAFVFAGAATVATGIFLVRARSEGPGRWIRTVAAAIVAGIALYIPWLAWAWWYYGSPIPQTIIAKTAMTPEGGLTLGRILTAPLRCLVDINAYDLAFAPPYSTDSWPVAFGAAWRILARLAAFAWLAPVLPRYARAASFAAMIGAVYLFQILPYPWYFGPWTMLGAISLAGVFQALARNATPLRTSFVRIAAALVIVQTVGLQAAENVTAFFHQKYVENAGRKQIGLWLKEHAQPGDRVFLEPLGYIGYFSGMKTLDYPGLSSREVSTLVHEGRNSYPELIEALKPEWIVIRPYEYVYQHLDLVRDLADYDLVFTSDVLPQVNAVPILPARDRVQFDARFMVFQRKAGEGADDTP